MRFTELHFLRSTEVKLKECGFHLLSRRNGTTAEDSIIQQGRGNQLHKYLRIYPLFVDEVAGLTRCFVQDSELFQKAGISGE